MTVSTLVLNIPGIVFSLVAISILWSLAGRIKLISSKREYLKQQVGIKIKGLISWTVSGNWPAKVGGLLLIISTGYLINYLLEDITIPPKLIISLSLLTGCSIAGLGHWVIIKRNKLLIGTILAGTGLGLVYLSMFYGVDVWKLAQDSVVLLPYSLLVGIVTGWVLRLNSMPLAIMAFFGGFLAPALAVSVTGTAYMLSYYLLLNLAIGFLVVNKGWRPLIHVGYVLTIAGAFISGTNWEIGEHFRFEPQVFLILFFALNLIYPIFEVTKYSETVLNKFDWGYILSLPIIILIMEVVLLQSVASEFELLKWTSLLLGTVYLLTPFLIPTKYMEILSPLRLVYWGMGVILAIFSLSLFMSVVALALTLVLVGAGLIHASRFFKIQWLVPVVWILHATAMFVLFNKLLYAGSSGFNTVYYILAIVSAGSLLLNEKSTSMLTKILDRAWVISVVVWSISRIVPLLAWTEWVQALIILAAVVNLVIMHRYFDFIRQNILVGTLGIVVACSIALWNKHTAGLLVFPLVLFLGSYFVLIGRNLGQQWLQVAAVLLAGCLSVIGVRTNAPWAMISPKSIELYALLGIVFGYLLLVGLLRLKAQVAEGLPAMWAVLVVSIVLSFVLLVHPNMLLALSGALVITGVHLYFTRQDTISFRADLSWVWSFFFLVLTHALVAYSFKDSITKGWLDSQHLLLPVALINLPNQAVISLVWAVLGLSGMWYAGHKANRFMWLSCSSVIVAIIFKLFTIDLATASRLMTILVMMGVSITLISIGYFVPIPPKNQKQS